MAVALILAADMQQNVVVVGRVAAAQRKCAHQGTALQDRRCNHGGYYLHVFFKTFICAGKVC